MLSKSKNSESIKIENLVKKYKNKKKAVNNLSLEIFNDQIFALLGHNGAGKTTTISIISGLISKSSGNINILGNDITKNSN